MSYAEYPKSPFCRSQEKSIQPYTILSRGEKDPFRPLASVMQVELLGDFTRLNK